MKIIETSMRHPVTVTMICLATALFGVISLSRLPVNLLPEITYPTLTIRTEYTDAAPAEIEALITEPLEEAVAVIQGLRSVTSVSRPGISEITMEFGWKTDMDYTALDVREKIDLVTLPDDVDLPVLLRYDPSLDPILRIGVYGDKDLATLRHLADRLLKRDLESLEGVASARIRGGLEEEIQVEVDEGRLAAYGIPISSVSQLLDRQNVNSAGGRLRDREAEFLIRTVNEFEEMDDIARTVLYEDEGRRIALGDVARIRMGHKDQEVVFRVQGDEAVELAIYKEGDANTVQVARGVSRRLERLKEELPDGVQAKILFDQSSYIVRAVNEVRSNALVGGLLAVLVLYLFLKDRRSTGIIALTIPLSILATFVVMQQLGVTLNIMSLGGLALGVGMMVDNSIVVLEAVNRRRAEGKSVWESTRLGASEVGRAVIASTLTTVAVFLPIIFVEGMAGQIFRDQALTVTASLMVSLLAALTLIPVFSSLGARRGTAGEAGEGFAPESRTAGGEMVPRPGTAGEESGFAEPAGSPEDPYGTPSQQGSPSPSPRRIWLRRAGLPFLWLFRVIVVFLPGGILWLLRWIAVGISFVLGLLTRPLLRAFDRIWDGFQTAYLSVLRSALLRRGRTVALALGLAAAAALLIPTLGVELIPALSQGELTFDLELPPGTPLRAAETSVGEVEGKIEGDSRIRTLFASVGESPDFGGARTERRENVAQIHLALSDPGNESQENAVLEEVREVLSENPEIDYTFRRPSYFSFKTPVEVQVFGRDLDELQRYAQALSADLSRIRGLQDVRCEMEEGSPEVQVRFRRDRVAALDLDLETIARAMRNKIHGDVATRLKQVDRDVDIRVRTAQAASLNADEISGLLVGQADGVPIHLSSVADVEEGRGPSQITRIGQQRAAVIRAGLAGRDLGSVSRDIIDLLHRTPPPRDMAVQLGGQNEEVSSSFRGLLLAAALAIFLVYMVMASQFESFLHPFVILFTVPLGLTGVVFALAMTGTPVSVVVLIGVVMLSGIVVNNAIVLVDFVNQRRAAGMEKMEALLDAGQARLRPILMTTLTTVLALLPMALGIGEGAELRSPLALAVIGGLLLATLLTLVVIPVVYSLLDRTA